MDTRQSREGVVYYAKPLWESSSGGGKSASIKLDVDDTNYGLDGGETMTFSGEFGNDFDVFVYAERYSE